MPSNRVSLSDGVITSMMGDPNFLVQFSFLQNPQKVIKSTCSRCPGRRRRATNRGTAQIDFNGLRTSFAGLSNAKKSQLKKMLDTKQVRVTYRNTAGRVRTLLF